MGGINSVLDTGLRALMAQQTGIQIVGHNIANVNTEGYSRQTIDFNTAEPIASGAFLIGSGVETAKVKRVYDKFLQEQLVNKSRDSGSWQSIEAGLSKVEMILNESQGSNINQAMSEFWNAWHDLANNPSGLPERSALVAKAENLTIAFNQTTSSLTEVQKDMDYALGISIGEINRMTEQVAQLNQLIVQAENGGSDANDFRDQRDLLLKKLSENININFMEDSKGSLNVYLKDGKALVVGTSTWQITTESNGNNSGLLDINWVDEHGNKHKVNSVVTGGTLGGSLQVRDDYVPDYLQKINELGASFIKKVNEIHSTGAGLEGFSQLTGETAVSAPDIPLSQGLTADSGISSGSFKIDVLDASNEVAASYTINYDPNIDNLTDLKNSINQLATGGEITASIQSNHLVFTGNGGKTFSLSGDSGGLLASLGINTFFSGTNATNISVNEVIRNDINKISTASAPGGQGDNTVALAIADLANALTMNEGEANFDSFYNTLIGQIGAQSQQAKRSSASQQVFLNQLTAQRDSVSGVSIDEEVTHLIKYQNAYAAAARLISVADELMQTVLDMVR